MTTTTLLRNHDVPVAWYFVQQNGETVGWVVRSDGRNWRAYVKDHGEYVGEAGMVGTFSSRKEAVAEVEYMVAEYTR